MAFSRCMAHTPWLLGCRNTKAVHREPSLQCASQRPYCSARPSTRTESAERGEIVSSLDPFRARMMRGLRMASSTPSRSFHSLSNALVPRVDSNASIFITQCPGSSWYIFVYCVLRSSNLQEKYLVGAASEGVLLVYLSALFSLITAKRTQSPYSGTSKSPSMAGWEKSRTYSDEEPLRPVREYSVLGEMA